MRIDYVLTGDDMERIRETFILLWQVQRWVNGGLTDEACKRQIKIAFENVEALLKQLPGSESLIIAKKHREAEETHRP